MYNQLGNDVRIATCVGKSGWDRSLTLIGVRNTECWCMRQGRCFRSREEGYLVARVEPFKEALHISSTSCVVWLVDNRDSQTRRYACVCRAKAKTRMETGRLRAEETVPHSSVSKGWKNLIRATVLRDAGLQDYTSIPMAGEGRVHLPQHHDTPMKQGAADVPSRRVHCHPDEMHSAPEAALSPLFLGSQQSGTDCR